jgi:hypothetical protein
MASQLKLTIVGDPTPLRNATRVAEKSLRNLLSSANKTSAGINKAFGAVGLTLGVTALANGLKGATKAASDDRKAQGLLANALRNTVGATAGAIAGAETYIRNTQLQTSVLDDELRPALQTAVRATGSLSSGQRLLNAALNISAETGKDLGSVTGALGKAFNGNEGALKKLVPGLKLTGDVLADVEKGFAGAAEKAAQLDPYKRLEVIFAELQETVGTAILPALEEFTNYLVSPDGQKNLQDIIQGFVAIGKAIVETTRFLIDNLGMVKAIVAGLVVLRLGWVLTTALVNAYLIATKNAVGATKLLKGALIATGIGAIAVAVGFLAESWIGANDAQEEYYGYVPPGATDPEAAAFGWTTPPKGAIPEWSDKWRELGYTMYGAYLEAFNKNKNTAATKAAEVAEEIKKALADKIAGLKKTAEKFRDAFGLAFGTFGKDENSVFNVDVVIAKLKRVVDAAKGFAENIKKLRKAKAGEDVINEIIGMGPAQGNIVAKGLLGSGKLQEYLGLRKSLYNTGASVGAEASMGTQNTYEININKAVISASDIIREIKAYEKKTGVKYLVK